MKSCLTCKRKPTFFGGNNTCPVPKKQRTIYWQDSWKFKDIGCGDYQPDQVLDAMGKSLDTASNATPAFLDDLGVE